MSRNTAVPLAVAGRSQPLKGGELDSSLADGHLPLAARASADGRKHIAMSFESLFNAGPGAETKDLKAVI